MSSPNAAVNLAGLGVVGGIFGWFFTDRLRGARRLVRAGYGRDDVVDALQLEGDRRVEELAHLYGSEYEAESRKLRRHAFTWLGLAVGIVTTFIILAPTSALTVWTAIPPTILGLVAWRGSENRADRGGKRLLKFWRGPLGYWLLKLAGFGVKAKVVSAVLTNRPTEIAIGAIIEGIYHSLPKETRETLGDLPDVVRGLEADAQRMRSTANELDGLLAGHSTTGPGPSAPRDNHVDRTNPPNELVASRDRARQRLSDTVAALENLRIDLIRLRAGNVNLDGVTANLGDARELSEQIDGLLDGYQATEEFLKSATGG